MKTGDVIGLAEKICWEYGFTKEVAQDKALKVLERCPMVLAQNVKEWSNGKKLTDIYIDKYSLPMILDIWNSKDFLKALDVMGELEKGNIEIAELRIWNMRR